MRIYTREILRKQYKIWCKDQSTDYKKSNPKTNMRSIKSHIKKSMPFGEFCKIYFGVRRGRKGTGK
jgi:hypothetical protein